MYPNKAYRLGVLLSSLVVIRSRTRLGQPSRVQVRERRYQAASPVHYGNCSRRPEEQPRLRMPI